MYIYARGGRRSVVLDTTEMHLLSLLILGQRLSSTRALRGRGVELRCAAGQRAVDPAVAEAAPVHGVGRGCAVR